MRYSIMLQLVTTITAIFVAAAALFAWIQNRQIDPSGEVGKTGAIEEQTAAVEANFDRLNIIKTPVH